MGFIDDNAHIWLLIMVIVVAGAIAGLSVVYQQNFKSINHQYDAKLQELNKTFNDLIGTKKELNNTISELEVKAAREEDLGSKYTLANAQKNQLATDKAQLQADLATKTTENAELTAKVTDLTNKFNSAEERANTLQSRADGLQTKIDCYKGQAPNANC